MRGFLKAYIKADIILLTLFLSGCTGISEINNQTITLPPDILNSDSVTVSSADDTSGISAEEISEDLQTVQTETTGISLSVTTPTETVPTPSVTAFSVPDAEEIFSGALPEMPQGTSPEADFSDIPDTADTADTYPENFSVNTLFPVDIPGAARAETVAVNTDVPAETEGTVISEMIGGSYFPPSNYSTLNYNIQRGIWISYLEYDSIMRNRTEEEFTAAVCEMFDNVLTAGINTVYVQVRAFGDAYYDSELFPRGDRLYGNYDPLDIMISCAHVRGLSVHAWINPMRLMTDEQMKELSEENVLKQMYNESQDSSRAGFMFESGGRWYLDPSKKESVELICAGISEILSKYKADGIQIDDYFYPETAYALDDASYKVSGTTLSREDWRRSIVDNMVKRMNYTVHAANPTAVFGISPSGNTDNNYSALFADTKKWCGDTAYCDYICPQIYYGFEHQTSPFETIASEWMLYTENSGVKLVIGLAAYKIGETDSWAGAGSNEWVDDRDVLLRQIEFCSARSCGTAVFRYDSLFGSAQAADELKEIQDFYRET